MKLGVQPPRLTLLWQRFDVVKPRTNVGYMLGLRRSAIPTEPAGKATFGVGTRARMAGDRLPLELVVPGYSPEPYVSGSDLRDELRGNYLNPRDLNQLIK